jgi:hypothetical protein
LARNEKANMSRDHLRAWQGLKKFGKTLPTRTSGVVYAVDAKDEWATPSRAQCIAKPKHMAARHLPRHSSEPDWDAQLSKQFALPQLVADLPEQNKPELVGV